MIQEIPIRRKKASVSTSSAEGPQVANPPAPPSRHKANGTNFTAGSSVRPKSIDELDPYAGKRKPKKVSSVSPRDRLRLQNETDDLRSKEDWKSFRPSHWVCLYTALHERIYGFYPMELEVGKMFGQARIAAARLLKTTFKGNAEMMVDFMRWTWVREEAREKWRRDNNQGGQRIGWRLQFSPAMVSDYRLDRTRKA